MPRLLRPGDVRACVRKCTVYRVCMLYYYTYNIYYGYLRRRRREKPEFPDTDTHVQFTRVHTQTHTPV